MKKIIEKEREVPVVWEGDVLVTGGGAAGVGAAITAAENGAKTLLVEKEECLGGLWTLGLVSLPCSYAEGAGKELFERLKENNGLKGRFADPEKTKYILETMVLESRSEILYSSYVVDSIGENDVIKGVVIESKSGREAILSKIVIDTSGDGDVAALAGAPFEKGSKKHQGFNQAVSLNFRLGNVDYPKHTKSLSLSKDSDWSKALRKALENKDIPYLPDKYKDWMIRIPERPAGRDEVIICFVTSRRCNTVSNKDLTRMVIEGRKVVQFLVKFVKKYIPGFENSWLIDTAPMLGVRDGRRIIGEYILTGEDIVLSKKFPDVIARDLHGIDVHHPTELGHIKHIDIKKPDGTSDQVRLRPGKYNEIPYRCLVPLKIDNLLVAGRCVSTTFEGQAGTRLIMTCLNMGQAAGTAAALSIREKTTPRRLNVKLLQDKLIEQGMNLREEPQVGHQSVSPELADKVKVKIGPADAFQIVKD